jgi:hypothetical protein
LSNASNVKKATEPGHRVKVGIQAKRLIATIPKEYATHLGIIEGISELFVTIEAGALVYRPVPKENWI